MTLEEKYIVPPFSILDSTNDRWRKRRAWWLSLGIESEVGRTDHAPGGGEKGGRGAWMRRSETGLAATDGKYDDGDGSEGSGVSVFDPVLCELVYRWWCPPGGRILDPMAGGSVRGIVAALMGHPYTGYDLSERQVEANHRQADRLVPPDAPRPTWVVADSRIAMREVNDQFDLIFTCPPYYDLEVYSENPSDLSAMPTYEDFLAAYRDIVHDAARWLRPNRYAVVVVSEVRDKHGIYRGLVPDTIEVLEDAGISYYNDVVLMQAVGSLAVRASRQFSSLRKIGRRHQNVLVGVKGSPERGWDVDREWDPNPQMEFLLA